MTARNLDELLIKATESDDQQVLSEILSEISKIETMSDNIKDGISMIIESWQSAPFSSPNKTQFLIDTAQFFDQDFTELRATLPSVLKKTIPKGINKTTAIKFLEVRKETVPLSKIYSRYLKLLELKTDRIFYNTHSNKWGIIGKPDWITSTITLLKLNGTALREAELTLILDRIYIFDPKINIQKLLDSSKLPEYKELIRTLNDNAYTPIGKNILAKAILSLFVPDKLNLQAYAKWIKASKSNNNDNKVGSIDNVRSVSELNILLRDQPSLSISEDNIPKLSAIFNTIKPSSPKKDFIEWAETIGLISKTLTPEQITSVIPKDNIIIDMFWPNCSELENSVGLETWCQLKAGVLPAWASVTEIIKGIEYLKTLCLYLPWRNWKSITSRFKVEELETLFNETVRLSNPEALLWVWRNRTKISDTLLRKLNHINFFSAISRGIEGAIWQAAGKELKSLIQDNKEFQNIILKKNNEASIVEFLEKLHSTDSFTTIEKQSLIVKLSRRFPILKEIFESGKVKKITSENDKETTLQSKDEIYITSTKSFNEKIAELNDIVNVQIPENTQAIATARAHGDLRENAEYAAAKERQKYLNEHRALLEMRIAKTRPTDFSDIVVTDKVIVGSTVHLKIDDSQKTEVYHILGSWDSVPEKKYLSYETELGKLLINKKIGESVTLPGDKRCTIEKIIPLADKIRLSLV